MQSQYGSPYQAAAPALEYVGVGRRFVATLVDSIIFLVVNGLIGVVFHAGMTNVNGVMTYNSSGPGAFLQIIIPFAYYIIMEATMGATVGKMALGIRVVKVDGSPISWGESVIRNLLRIIDGLFGYLLGAILVWTSPTKQRLGDRAAKTVVVRRR